MLCYTLYLTISLLFLFIVPKYLKINLKKNPCRFMIKICRNQTKNSSRVNFGYSQNTSFLLLFSSNSSTYFLDHLIKSQGYNHQMSSIFQNVPCTNKLLHGAQRGGKKEGCCKPSPIYAHKL